MGFAAAFISALATLWNIFLWTWWLIVIALLYVTKKRWAKYPMDAVIIEKRGDNLLKTNDRIGRIEDKHTGLVTYQLSKSKETIPVYNYEWILHNAEKHTNFLERIINFLRPTIGTIFLFRYGSKQYKPINIKGNDKTKLSLKEIKGKDGLSLYKYEYGHFDPRWVLGVLDFEVIDWDNMNFMVQEQRAIAERRKNKADFWKSLAIPAMALGVTALVCIFILKFSSEQGAALRGGAGQPSSDGGGSKVLGGIDNAFTPGT